MNDFHKDFSPEIQTMIVQLHQALVRIQPEHREKVVTDLLAKVYREISTFESGEIRKDSLQRELMLLYEKKARLGPYTPEDVTARIVELEQKIHKMG
ncbi:MAG: hypothetical protein GFH27_549347n56 [Chloroflexi bacterium AL-W]|nr:hypothetical protein [Chloroflexi bacterium AL-N1]NOK70838.1 hypothetical protein [Chloroflexi bacterium AL-N10]NOK78398.1 hypothetical protein [Chloroflexi bacterium AL-N5]NOK85379.1 hypothetical protein [Chloroflexi bacterium AL-W]NOK92655.1 hypothetical protein [Chloroflexi bacterium AL-N15]